MVWIKKLYICGFKNFKDLFEISFSQNKNLIIGVNGIGKSTILQAIDLVLQKRGITTFGNGNLGYAHYINRELIKDTDLKFKDDSGKNFTYSDLPKITIAIEFGSSNEKEDGLNIFSGAEFPEQLNWSNSNDKIGLAFEYKFDNDFKNEFNDYLDSCEDSKIKNEEYSFDIPFEFYTARWKTFGSENYTSNKDPLKTLLIDNDAFQGDPFNIFAKRLYSSMDLINQINSRINFRRQSKKVELGEKQRRKDYKLLIDPNTVNLENIIDVLDQKKKIFVRDLGSGEENLVKTRLSFNSSAKLVLIEEPENHLTSENTRKQIELIRSNFDQKTNKSKQIILTTHNPEVITQLDLKNAIWLRKDNKGGNIEAKRLEDIKNKKTINFFNHRSDLDFLKILTAKRVIIVEGATEFVLMRTLLQRCGYSTEASNSVEIVSMVGRYYDPFIDLAKVAGNKILIFTDNDYLADNSKKDILSSNDRINTINDKNKKYHNVQIFCSQSKKGQWQKEWTFEAAVYNKNKKIIKRDDDFQKSNSCKKYAAQLRKIGNPKKLMYMLNNKTGNEAELIREKYRSGKLKVPGYIKKGFKWLFYES